MDCFIDLRDMAFVHWRFPVSFFFFFTITLYVLFGYNGSLYTTRTDYPNRQLFLPGDQQAAAVFLPDSSGIQYMSLALKRLQSLPVLLSFCFRLFFSTLYLKLYLSHWILLFYSVDDFF